MSGKGTVPWRRALSLLLTLGLLCTLLTPAAAAGGETGVTRNVTLTMDTMKNCDVYYSEGGRWCR